MLTRVEFSSAGAMGEAVSSSSVLGQKWRLCAMGREERKRNGVAETRGGCSVLELVSGPGLALPVDGLHAASGDSAKWAVHRSRGLSEDDIWDPLVQKSPRTMMLKRL